MPLAMTAFADTVFGGMILIAVTILWVTAVVDCIHHRYGGLKLAALLVLILAFPVIGPLLYFIFREPDPYDAEKARLAAEDLRRETVSRPIGGVGTH